MKRRLFAHLVLSALLGFLTLLVVGALMASSEEALAAKLGGDARVQMLWTTAVGGAVAGLGTALLLLLFPVGPTSKVFFGAVCGPAVAALLFGTQTLRGDRPSDLAGLVVIALAAGLLVGTLEANRVLRERRRAASE